jgi:hypothetical protein
MWQASHLSAPDVLRPHFKLTPHSLNGRLQALTRCGTVDVRIPAATNRNP